MPARCCLARSGGACITQRERLLDNTKLSSAKASPSECTCGEIARSMRPATNGPLRNAGAVGSASSTAIAASALGTNALCTTTDPSTHVKFGTDVCDEIHHSSDSHTTSALAARGAPCVRHWSSASVGHVKRGTRTRVPARRCGVPAVLPTHSCTGSASRLGRVVENSSSTATASVCCRVCKRLSMCVRAAASHAAPTLA